MRVSVVGLGFVGLTTAVCLANRGIEVLGIDTDKNKVNLVSSGHAPFYERDLGQYLKKSLGKGKLAFSTDFKDLPTSNITILAVGTPSKKDGSANLSFLVNASRAIGNALKPKKTFHVIAVKSTVPPGTTSNVVAPQIETSSGKKILSEFGVCSNPEFLREGTAISDTLYPDKVVVGTIDIRTKNIMNTFYRKFYYPQKIPIINTNPQTAELIKYANNSFLATKISFINTIANICQNVPGTDIQQIAYAIGLDKRIGSLFLKAGLGYGGSCFPKDVAAMIALSRKHGYTPELLISTHKINELQPFKAVELLNKAIPIIAGKTVAILGLAFKPETTDMREAVSIKIIEELIRLGAKVRAHDPLANNEAKRILGDKITFCQTIEECLDGSNACIVATEWKQFQKLSPSLMKKHMKETILIDGRRLTQPKAFEGKITKYLAVGLS